MNEMIPLSTTDRLRVIADAERRKEWQKYEKARREWQEKERLEAERD